jgi:hypothetical protein
LMCPILFQQNLFFLGLPHCTPIFPPYLTNAKNLISS